MSNLKQTQTLKCSFNEEAITNLYRRDGVACDSLITDQQLLFNFTRDYVKMTHTIVTSEAMGKKLLTMRKRGAAHGGLPRLRRA